MVCIEAFKEGVLGCAFPSMELLLIKALRCLIVLSSVQLGSLTFACWVDQTGTCPGEQIVIDLILAA